jgi:hypothetical protein
MPKPVYLSSFQLDYLRVQLQHVSGISISDARGCKSLVEYLEKTHKVFISESTLKRLFGLISSNKSASLYTLNLIAEVLGFKNWKKLIERIEHTSFEEINHVLLNHFVPNQGLVPTSFLNSPELKLNSWSEAYQLYIYSSNLIVSQNWEAMHELFDCAVNSEDLQQFDYLIFAFQPFCLHAFRGDKALIDFINAKLETSEIAQIFILTGQVFDAKLTDYYGRWIDTLSQDIPDKLYPFIKLMQCQMQFMNKNTSAAQHTLSEVITYSETKALHPILKGRVGAWSYILNHDEDYLNRDLAKYSDELSQIETLQFASRLVWQYADAEKVFTQFDNLTHTEANLTNTFYQKGRLDCYKLAKAYNLKLQKSTQYKEVLKQVNPHYFHLSDLAWLQDRYKQLLAE